jgi:LysR family glycine cleavage system transcriptional activator
VGPWPPLVCEKFLDDEYFPVASPKLYRGKLPRTPKELHEARIIREDRDLWDQWFKAAGIAVGAPGSGPVFNDSTYALQAAARGEGIALARRTIIGEDLERGTLKRLFDIPLTWTTSYWFVSPKDTAGMEKVKRFREWVRAELAAGPARDLVYPKLKR